MWAGTPVAHVARAFGVERQTIYKWLRGRADAETRSSRPHHSPTRLKRRYRRQILKRRRQRWSSRRIAQHSGLPVSSVGRELRRLGLGRLPRIEPPRPGELVHLDVKQLGRIGTVGHRIHGDFTRRARGGGWESVHVAIDDHTRLACVEVLADESADTAGGFLRRAVASYAALGIGVERILTDNGSCDHGLPFAEHASASP